MKIKVAMAQSHHIVLLTGLNYWKNWSLQEEGRCLGCPQWVPKNFSITKWSLVLVFTRYPSYLKTPLSFLFRWFDFTLNSIFFYFFSSDHWTSTSKSFRKSQNTKTKWRSLSYAITHLTEKIDSINRLTLTWFPLAGLQIIFFLLKRYVFSAESLFWSD